MSPPLRLFWAALGGVSIAYHLGLIFHGLIPNLVSRPLHMVLVLPWALVFMAKTRAQMWSGMAITLLGGGAALWVAVNQDMLGDQYGFLANDFQRGIAASGPWPLTGTVGSRT